MNKPLTGLVALLGVVVLLPLTAGASPQENYERQSGARGCASRHLGRVT